MIKKGLKVTITNTFRSAKFPKVVKNVLNCSIKQPEEINTNSCRFQKP